MDVNKVNKMSVFLGNNCDVEINEAENEGQHYWKTYTIK